MSSISSFKMPSSQIPKKGKKRDKTCHRNNKALKVPRSRNSDSICEDDAVGTYTTISEVAPLKNNEPLPQKFEKKLSQAIGNSTEKSSQVRSEALQSICQILMHHYTPDLVEDHQIELIDSMEKSLRNGKADEQVWAAHLLPLMALQLGEIYPVTKTFNKLLVTIIENEFVSLATRSKCCTALGLLNYLAEEDSKNLITLMKSLENIFNGSSLKNQEQSPDTETSTLQIEALKAWALLLTVFDPENLEDLEWDSIVPDINIFLELLQSSQVDIRLAAGEVMALILEKSRNSEEEFLFEDYFEDLAEIVQQMANDSSKYHAKRDRKVQKTNFRDIFNYLRDDISPAVNIRFGKETLVLDSWASLHQYALLCTVMGPGITTHLENNDTVRNIFDLGNSVKEKRSPKNARAKTKKHMVRSESFKSRTKSMKKNRDKRSEDIFYEI